MGDNSRGRIIMMMINGSVDGVALDRGDAEG